tara:strand:- start:1442 stop:1837 length:396 start_codon:yes stop_codon:yes gene_type:complete
MFTLQGIPATKYNCALFVEESSRPDYLDDIILWVGVDAHAVSALVDGGACIETEVRRRLQEMLDNEEISISKEYTVTASVTVTCTVQDSIEARSEGAAADLMHERIGEGLVDDLFDDHTIDDIDITDVEVY